MSRPAVDIVAQHNNTVQPQPCTSCSVTTHVSSIGITGCNIVSRATYNLLM